LFATAALVWCATRGNDTPGAATPHRPDAGSSGRPTAWVDEDLEIPELEPDAGPPPDAGGHVPVDETRTTRGPTTTRSWDSCTGEIPQEAARRVIQEYNAQIRTCYERRLKQNPLLEGTMVLAVRVAPDGRVDGTQVSGSLHDREVFQCVRQIASRMRFPAPGGRDCALVQVPFQFTPRR
jgi:TonB family protein